jgi:DNA-binding NarL/FixJ family response regulator
MSHWASALGIRQLHPHLARPIIVRSTVHAHRTPEVAMTHSSTGAALRVLVVDDCAALRESVSLALEREGLTVVGEAADGAQALAQAAAYLPDVVLMDLRMPGMGGIRATQTIRRRYPETSVVLWTGDGDPQLASAMRQSGAHAGLLKGIPTSELVAALRAVCDRHHRDGVTARG